jgi:hypothetical protein
MKIVHRIVQHEKKMNKKINKKCAYIRVPDQVHKMTSRIRSKLNENVDNIFSISDATMYDINIKCHRRKS